MDWSRCLICQESTTEVLRCPLNIKGTSDKSQPYGTFLANVSTLRNLNQMPVKLNIGEGITVNELIQNNGSWHKSCYSKFNKEKVERAIKKREREDTLDSSSSGEKRSRRQSTKRMACLFCGQEDGHLHDVRTFGAEANIRLMAKDLQETELLARIEGSDLVALDAKYHLHCLTDLRNRHRSLMRQYDKEAGHSSEEKIVKARALVELFTFVENSVEEGTFHFKLSDLNKLYEKRLQQLGLGIEINRTRLKDKVLAYFPQAQEQTDGKNKVLVFQQGMKQIIKQTMESDYEDEIIMLAKVAKIVRRDITSFTGFHFNGKFTSECQEESVPTTLKTLVSLLLYGPDLKDQDCIDSQASLTISQMILFNSKKHKSSSTKARHSQDREPPLPLYIGLKVHTETRSKKMITQLHDLGLSVSYERVLQLESQLATAVCEDFNNKGVVVPAPLRRCLFTVGAIDNLDHNPTSTTAKGSFHGTGISLFQFPISSNMGEKQNDITLSACETKTKLTLPDKFTTVPAVALKPTKVSVPKSAKELNPKEAQLENEKSRERNWLRHASQLLRQDDVEKGESIAWSAFHASRQDTSEDKHVSLTQLLPLFYEKAATAAMIKHGMDVVRWATEYLNSGQIPVIVCDMPLFILTKFTQWNWPKTHGEDMYIAMLGGLHIEMAMWKTFGDYLRGSGWANVLTQAGIASSGTADSFFKASHLTRTRHAHQVTALALAKLQEEAFLSNEGDHSHEAKETWRQEMVDKSPTFQYWDTVLNMELLGLLFIRSHREGNFILYVECLKQLAPWFFALNHHNYARWIPIHIRDMESLPASVHTEFKENGHWVIRKTNKRFSTIPVDQAHEQNNEAVKGSGGALGLTENPIAFRKWMVAGPEQARLLKEFEDDYLRREKDQVYHHEEGLCTQRNFKQQTMGLIQAINEIGNPFSDDSDELLTLDTRVILDEPVVNTVRTVHSVGKDQFDTYYNEVVTNCTRSIHQPIKKNALPLFTYIGTKDQAKQAGKVSLLKNDVNLFSHLYIVMQHRTSDLSTFFSHENHPFPPSLSEGGKLRIGKKSDLLSILTNNNQYEPPESVDIKLLDGPAVVHFLSPNNAVTFDEYADQIFVPYIVRQLETSKRIDIVWDTYIPSSIKETTRERRGRGVRRKVGGTTKLPGKWSDFLRDSANKQELFAFLSNKIATADWVEGKEVIVTNGSKAIIIGSDRSMAQCDHEEADTRLMVHLQDALLNGHSTCVVRSVDTDVVVILLGKFSYFKTLNKDLKIWVAFGTGKNFTYHSINTMYEELGMETSIALPVFHSFTGCDTTSAFYGKGKKSAWEAWKSYKDVTQVFTYIANHPYKEVNIESEHFQLLEHFTVVLYDKTSGIQHVNEARKELFCVKGKTMETLPPTQEALLQHLKRAAYQASIWCTSERSEQDAPSPEGWGWTLNQDGKSWLPVWSMLPPVSKACSELVKCKCKNPSGCSVRCSCIKAKLKCTELCACHCEK